MGASALNFTLLPSLLPSHDHLIFSSLRPLPSNAIPKVTLLRIRPLIGTKAANDDNIQPPSESASPPPEAVEIRFRRGSRRRARLEEEGGYAATPKAKSPPKSWESMSVGEKAVELYVGEKGLLFWLNKFAYASIFIIIGGWILFRFVGPSVGLYQLDSAPLSPTNLFKGS